MHIMLKHVYIYHLHKRVVSKSVLCQFCIHLVLNPNLSKHAFKVSISAAHAWMVPEDTGTKGGGLQCCASDHNAV